MQKSSKDFGYKELFRSLFCVWDAMMFVVLVHVWFEANDLPEWRSMAAPLLLSAAVMTICGVILAAVAKERKDKREWKALLYYLSVLWCINLIIVLAMLYLASSTLSVWKNTALPWLIGCVAIAVIGVIYVALSDHEEEIK